MDLSDRILELSNQIPKRLPHISTEEATKNAFIMPFINALGYDVFNPGEVTPEFVADVGIKKGEKIDYAILKDGQPIILIECKTAGRTLSLENSSQLFRYFATTDVRFAILTNGISYEFYSDIEKPNKMDEKPFFVFDMTEIKSAQIEELKKFTKERFDIDEIVSIAGELKYTREIKRILGQQLNEPDEDFVRFFVSQVYSGRFTQNVREQFALIIKEALAEFIQDRVNRRLQIAIDTTDSGDSSQPVIESNTDENSTVDESQESEEDNTKSNRIVTTEEEIEAYHIVKSILREVVDAKRIAMRDAQSYCSIFLDDNNRKPIVRFYFNRSQYQIGLVDADKNEERVAIETIDDIYKHAEQLKSTVGYYEG